jgi:antirestriction protein
MDKAPSIYVACLASHNAGNTVGRWIDADQGADDIRAEIADMLAQSPAPGAEEWIILDSDGFGPYEVHEYEPIESVSAIGLGISKFGPAFAAWAAYTGGENLNDFLDAYAGQWSSVEEFAQTFVEDMEGDPLSKLPEYLRYYVHVDWEWFARDLDIHTEDAPGGGVYVFWTSY